MFTLLVLFQIKHFLCDFPLQGKYMLQKFKPGWGFVLPLAAHAGVHAALTLLICRLIEAPWLLALQLAGFDFTAHFLIDRVKASPKMLGRYTPENKYFWWALGADQALHHLTSIAIIWKLTVA